MAHEKSDFSELEKNEISHGTFHDHDIIRATDKEYVDRFGHLSEEELATEKKLKRKIDLVIMPTTILVYLMNYIGI